MKKLKAGIALMVLISMFSSCMVYVPGGPRRGYRYGGGYGYGHGHYHHGVRNHNYWR